MWFFGRRPALDDSRKEAIGNTAISRHASGPGWSICSLTAAMPGFASVEACWRNVLTPDALADLQPPRRIADLKECRVVYRRASLHRAAS